MGMFDYVKYEAACPQCGEINSDWQSKDGDCILAFIEPKDVHSFYTLCTGCGVWINATVDKGITVHNIILTTK